jgi:aldehyde:ferredoxin oxidoreductase
MELGKSVLRNELEFNKRAGFTKADDQLPEFFSEEFPPHKTTWDFTIDDLQKTLAL